MAAHPAGKRIGMVRYLVVFTLDEMRVEMAMSNVSIADIVNQHYADPATPPPESLTAALVQREQAMADLLRMAGVQFGMYPQIVAEVLAEIEMGEPISVEQRTMEAVAEAALHREAASHGVSLQPRRSVPDPEPEYHRLIRRIGVDLIVVTGLINGLRSEGQRDLADRATGELREVLAKGIAELEVIPDTIEGLA